MHPAPPAAPVNIPPILLPPESYQLIPIADLLQKQHPDNNNTHPKAQLKTYIAILRAGIRQPIILSSLTARIVKGHGALHAAHLAGWTHWPCQYQDFDTLESELAHLIGDNQIARGSKADEASTAGIISRIHATAPTGFDIRRTGFSKPKITALLASLREEKPDPIKPPPPLKLPIHPAWQAAASAAGLSLPDWSLATLNAAAA